MFFIKFFPVGMINLSKIQIKEGILCWINQSSCKEQPTFKIGIYIHIHTRFGACIYRDLKEKRKYSAVYICVSSDTMWKYLDFYSREL